MPRQSKRALQYAKASLKAANKRRQTTESTITAFNAEPSATGIETTSNAELPATGIETTSNAEPSTTGIETASDAEPSATGIERSLESSGFACTDCHRDWHPAETKLGSENDCELNYIEYYWGAVKRYTRENCNYSFLELEHTVRAGFDSVSLRTIRRFANRARRWIDAYIGGLNEKQQAFVEMQKSSHRRVMGEKLIGD